MNVIESDLPGCLVVEPKRFEDARGWFQESFSHAALARIGLEPEIVQANVSRSAPGVLRGLHYQWPNPQGKWVSVPEGEVWDVAVDMRRGSPTFGRWTAVVLSAGNGRQFWIPEGFAHGFAVLGDVPATVHYLCTRGYDAAADAGIRWDDPDLAIAWPLRAPVLSEKDAHAPLLAQIPSERLPDCPVR